MDEMGVRIILEVVRLQQLHEMRGGGDRQFYVQGNI
jgi:hypothetical protein